MTKTPKREAVDAIAKWVTVAATLVGVLWGIYGTLQTQAVQSRRPFLELQLKLYLEATETAATLATSSDPTAVQESEAQFERLYWGMLAVVENGGVDADSGGVEGAMVRFRQVLRATPRNQAMLQQASLDLAHACRNSLAASWGVPDWKSPQYVSGPSRQ